MDNKYLWGWRGGRGHGGDLLMLLTTEPPQKPPRGLDRPRPGATATKAQADSGLLLQVRPIFQPGTPIILLNIIIIIIIIIIFEKMVRI